MLLLLTLTTANGTVFLIQIPRASPLRPRVQLLCMDEAISSWVSCYGLGASPVGSCARVCGGDRLPGQGLNKRLHCNRVPHCNTVARVSKTAPKLPALLCKSLYHGRLTIHVRGQPLLLLILEPSPGSIRSLAAAGRGISGGALDWARGWRLLAMLRKTYSR